MNKELQYLVAQGLISQEAADEAHQAALRHMPWFKNAVELTASLFIIADDDEFLASQDPDSETYIEWERRTISLANLITNGDLKSYHELLLEVCNEMRQLLISEHTIQKLTLQTLILNRDLVNWSDVQETMLPVTPPDQLVLRASSEPEDAETQSHESGSQDG